MSKGHHARTPAAKAPRARRPASRPSPSKVLPAWSEENERAIQYACASPEAPRAAERKQPRRMIGLAQGRGTH